MIPHCRNGPKIQPQNRRKRPNRYPLTHIHNSSLSWFSTGSSVKSGGVRVVVWIPTYPLGDMMRLCKCFLYVSEMPTLKHNRAITAIIKNALILNIIHNIFNIRDTEMFLSKGVPMASTIIWILDTRGDLYGTVHRFGVHGLTNSFCKSSYCVHMLVRSFVFYDLCIGSESSFKKKCIFNLTRNPAMIQVLCVYRKYESYNYGMLLSRWTRKQQFPCDIVFKIHIFIDDKWAVGIFSRN